MLQTPPIYKSCRGRYSLFGNRTDKVRAKAYDIVLNGVELGGGSIRIHDQNLQTRMFNVLGFSKEDAWRKFGFLLRHSDTELHRMVVLLMV